MTKRKYDINFFKEYALRKGGICLSDKYTNQKTKLNFKCSENHIFDLEPQKMIARDYWCPKCTGRNTRHTVESISEIVEERGWKLLSEEFHGLKEKHKFQCNKGHIIEAQAGNVIKGSGCSICSKKQRLTIEIFKEYAINKGGECLSKDYFDLKTKLDFRCSNNHEFSLYPSKIRSRNYWCPECSGRKQHHTIESIRIKVEERDWKFLSKEFKTVMDKYLFECDKGHQVEMFASNVLKGVGCRTCAGKQLLTIKEFQNIAEDNGGKCLSNGHVDTKTKLRFRCEEGHEFEATSSSIKYAKSWCPTCSGLVKGTIGEMYKIAESKGGKCLSDKYVNNKTKLKWQCLNGHTWYATPRDIKHSDSWCPDCTFYKNESKCRYIFENLLKTEFKSTRKILEGRLELDGYSHDLKLAFEYNGEQHYDTNHFFNYNKEKLEELRKNDKEKKEQCVQKGIDLIIIPYWEAYNDYDFVQFICKQLEERGLYSGQPPKNILENYYKNHSILNEIKEIIKLKNGTLLSEEYTNSKTKIKIQCNNDGYIWETTYYQLLKKGSWCPKCSGKYKRTIEDMQQIAESRGGKCLSTEYKNLNTKLKFQCSKGHEWKTTPSSILIDNWCPECSGSKKLTIEKMQQIAESRGGKCLSDKYINNSTKLIWECQKGHKWEAMPMHVKNKKSWCPVCAGKNPK